MKEKKYLICLHVIINISFPCFAYALNCWLLVITFCYVCYSNMAALSSPLIIYLEFSGISRSARGYCITLILETMKTYSLEDGLTEDALVTKLRTCRYHHLFLHTSLRRNTSGLHFLLFHLAFDLINAF